MRRLTTALLSVLTVSALTLTGLPLGGGGAVINGTGSTGCCKN